MNKESKLNIILFSMLSLFLGIILIISTDKILDIFNFIFVCIFAIVGVIELISFIVAKEHKENNYFKLIVSIISIWLALIIYKYYMMYIVLPMLFSLYLFFIGSFMIIKYFNNKNIKYNIKNLILGILSIIVGILLILEPKLPMYTYLKITGVNMIIIAIIFIFDLVRMIRKSNG